MVDLGEKKQTLYWVEGQMTWMEGKPHRMEFVRCWRMVNNLGLVACPDKSEPLARRFGVPDSWLLKDMVQSE
jgi:hypothetical protein